LPFFLAFPLRRSSDLAILLGRRKAIVLQSITFLFIYLLTAFFILSGKLPVWSLLVYISLGSAIKTIKLYKGKAKPLELMPAMIATGKTNTLYGFLLGISLLLSVLFY